MEQYPRRRGSDSPQGTEVRLRADDGASDNERRQKMARPKRARSGSTRKNAACSISINTGATSATRTWKPAFRCSRSSHGRGAPPRFAAGRRDQRSKARACVYADHAGARRGRSEQGAGGGGSVVCRRGGPEPYSTCELSADEIAESGLRIPDLLVLSKLAASKSDARRLIAGGGVFVGERKVDSVSEALDAPLWRATA